MGYRCDRCYQDTLSCTGSQFNTEMICRDCAEKERAHPDYERARAADQAAVRARDYNFPGIGKPTDL